MRLIPSDIFLLLKYSRADQASEYSVA